MNVRLLLDENFPDPSVRLLRQAGLDVLSVSESHPGMDDPAAWVLQWVRCQPAPIGMFAVYDGVSLRNRPLLLT